MAANPRDVLARRLRLEMLDWKATLEAIPAVSQLLAEECSWTEIQTEQAASTYQALISAFQAKIETA
jgi:glycerol-3-phosphate dehydrogenase